jgi:AAA+ ATPase superfamily predicted ATPase
MDILIMPIQEALPEGGAPFHNRQREIEVLQHARDSGRAELFILYGRRGVGKSALLAHSLADSRRIYFRATRRTLPLQLDGLTVMVREAYPDLFLPQPFASFDQFLELLARQARALPGEPIIVVIDELPYLADVDPGLLTTLQHWWDGHKHVSNVKLFLAGSYTAFMERQVLDANAPLYNRRTGSLKLPPFDYAEAALFFPRYSARERLEAYAVLGGMPSYLEQFDPERGLEDNLLVTALRRNTYLNEEPDWLLLEDLRRDVTHGSILRAVATGHRRPSEIARAIGKQSAQDVSAQLDTLLELELIRREVPITERQQPRSRNSLYFLADNYLAFWYRYVDPGRSLIAQGLGNRVLARIRATFHEHVSRPPFEEACRQFMWRAYAAGALPPDLAFDAVGTWWDGSHEIDVVAMEGNTTTLAGSCKWTNALVGPAELRALQEAVAAGADQLRPAPGCWYALFSREGFTADLTALARLPAQRLRLFVPADLFP